MTRRFVFLCPVGSLLILVGCGGGNGGGPKVSAQPPIFTTTAPAAAAQGVAYNYSLAATDPSGGTVTFAMTTAPTGATLSGSTLSWTPTAAQSRTGNSFSITATTSENATATQSWTISPTGVVTVNAVDSYWEPNGPVQVPVPNTTSLEVSAIVPQSDGSLLVLKGATASPGVISIIGVPAGNYWLALGPISELPQGLVTAYWTSTSTFDAGRDIAGFPPPPAVSTPGITQFDFNLSGLASVNAPSEVVFNPAIGVVSGWMNVPANSTSVSGAFGYGSTVDWTKVSDIFLVQYVPLSLTPLSLQTVATAANPTNLSFANGATNTIAESLAPGTPTQFDLIVQGSQFQSSFTNAAPVAPISYASGFTIVAEPGAVGIDAQAGLTPTNLVLAGTSSGSPQGIIIYPFDTCDATGFPATIPLTSLTGILNDTNLGTLSYDDPFPSSWTRVETFCEEALVPIAIPGSTQTAGFALVASTSATPSSSPIVPLIGPVQNPTIAGGSLFTAATLTSSTPTLSWTAPATGSPYGYHVIVFVLTSLNNVPVYLDAGSFYTSNTSMTLPPLSAGNTYVFSIASELDGTANVQTAPFRTSLPSGFASAVSAPITISSGAASTQIHGDARIVNQFSQPRTGAAVRR